MRHGITGTNRVTARSETLVVAETTPIVRTSSTTRLGRDEMWRQLRRVALPSTARGRAAARARDRATDPPTRVIASGNWGSVDLKGYTVEVPEGTTELQVHLLNSVTVAGERLNFTKKVPYALKIEEASNVVPGRTLDEPRTLVFDVKKTYKVAIAP